MAKRIEKVDSLLRQEIGKIILHDFSFSPDILVTITRVQTTSNLIEAKVFVSVFPEAKSDGILNALQKSVYNIQYQINRVLRQRPVPKIIFVKDTVISKAGKIDELLAMASDESGVEKTKKID